MRGRDGEGKEREREEGEKRRGREEKRRGREEKRERREEKRERDEAQECHHGESESERREDGQLLRVAAPGEDVEKLGHA